MDSDAERSIEVRYQPDERPPLPVTLGLGFQYAILCIGGVVLTPAILIGVGGGSDAYLSWAVFTALLVSGVSTAIQVLRIGRIGAGYILIMGSNSAFLAVCISALQQGGPDLMATLIVLSSGFQFLLASKLSLLRKIFTPTVAGTVLMLIPVTIAPSLLSKLEEVPAEASSAAAPVCAAVALIVIVAISLRGSSVWRLWAPAIGIVAGSLVGGLYFGIYDGAGVREAAWVGLPERAWPGLDLDFGPDFWALLPSFVLVTLVGAMDTVGDTIAIQRISWRRPRAIDFRSIQGALSADGVGNLLSGLIGTVPNTTYASGIAVADQTRVAARAVGVCVAAIFVVLAFLPKFLAAILAIPGPVAAAFFIVVLSSLFIMGMKILLNEGLDSRKSFVVGLAMFLGIAFELDWIFPEYFEGTLSELLGDGMTVGGFTVIVLTQFVELTGPRRRRLKMALDGESFARIEAFLSEFAARGRRDEEMTHRLRAVGEEMLLTLDRPETEPESGPASDPRHILLIAADDGDAVDLEFVASTDETNLEDQIALLAEPLPGAPIEEEASLRLLSHYASSVRHQQFHDTEVITVRVAPPASL
ncbi:MAG: purine/pyrimidine permease [Proteobacteria bacterium]|nr:purine/pyrimidine permease [Pseudomonadota bacterium]